MARLPNNRPPQDPRRVVYVQRKRKQQRKTPRWELLVVPLALLFAGWFLSQVVVSVSFDGIADAFCVRDREKFRGLMMLGLLCVGAAIAARCWKDSRKGD